LLSTFGGVSLIMLWSAVDFSTKAGMFVAPVAAAFMVASREDSSDGHLGAAMLSVISIATPIAVLLRSLLGSASFGAAGAPAMLAGLAETAAALPSAIVAVVI